MHLSEILRMMKAGGVCFPDMSAALESLVCPLNQDASQFSARCSFSPAVVLFSTRGGIAGFVGG